MQHLLVNKEIRFENTKNPGIQKNLACNNKIFFQNLKLACKELENETS